MKKLWLIVICLTATLHLHAQERITVFKSKINIHKDASMTVQEDITVVALGSKIKRGIFRDFPTQYKDRYNNTVSVGLDVQNITLNGKPVPYEIKNLANGKRIYIGNKKKRVRRGTHTYTITYKTNRQLGFFEKHDELYWNVAGNGWIFDIDKAFVSVKLPEKVPADAMTIEGYTGYQGSKGQEYSAKVTKPGSVQARTTSSLAPRQGFTIAMTFPKGIIAKPSATTEWLYFIKDNWGLLVSLALLILLLICYIIITIKVRSNKIPYPDVPLFHPPKDLLPSQIYFLKNMSYGHLALTSEIVNMACNGLLTIEQQEGGFFSSGSYNLHKKDADQPTNRIHAALMNYLFAASNTLILVKNSIYMRNANRYMKEVLQGFLGSKYIDDKHKYPIIGGIIYACTGAGLLYTNETQFFAVLGIGLLLHVPFFFLLRTYTSEGDKLLAEINGFKLFLETTEVERMKIVGTPPTKTPELYEKYLPYAMAFGVEEQWTKQFGAMFTRMEQEGNAYVPVWYTGYALSSFRTDKFSNNLSRSLGSMVAAAATKPPSSSFGSGGRGSSGGGGGGGGGGGW